MKNKIQKLQKQFNDKYEELCETREDPTEEWMQYIEEQGGESFTCRTHWELADYLIELIHDREKVFIIDDPVWEGSSEIGYIILKEKD